MASAWGSSWGVAWGNSWGDTGSTPVTPPAVGFPARRIRRSDFERRLKEQRDNTFSRRRFEELVAAERAQAEVEAKAAELKESKRKQALQEAAATAAQAIDAAEVDTDTDDLARMTAALSAAANATRTAEVIRQARIARSLAQAMIAAIEEEEEAILLLMLH